MSLLEMGPSSGSPTMMLQYLNSRLFSCSLPNIPFIFAVTVEHILASEKGNSNPSTPSVFWGSHFPLWVGDGNQRTIQPEIGTL